MQNTHGEYYEARNSGNVLMVTWAAGSQNSNAATGEVIKSNASLAKKPEALGAPMFSISFVGSHLLGHVNATLFLYSQLSNNCQPTLLIIYRDHHNAFWDWHLNRL